MQSCLIWFAQRKNSKCVHKVEIIGGWDLDRREIWKRHVKVDRWNDTWSDEGRFQIQYESSSVFRETHAQVRGVALYTHIQQSHELQFPWHSRMPD